MDILAELEKGVKLQSHSQFEEADCVYNNIISFDPSIADAYNLLGLSAFQRDLFLTALPLFRKAIRLNNSRYDFYFNCAECYRLTDDYDHAIEYYTKSQSLNENFLESIINMSTCLIEKESFAEAYNHLQNALKIDSESFLAHLNLAKTHLGQNQLSSALEHLNLCLELNPENIDTLMLIVEVFLKQKKYRNIKKLCNGKRNLQHELIYNSLGLVAKIEKQFDRAIKYFLKSLDINSDCHEAHNNLALCYKKQGNLDDAQKHLETACTLSPEDESLHYNLAGVYVLQGMKIKALESYRKVLTLDPDNSSVIHMINALSGEDSQKAPQQYVETLFDAYAETFERDLIDTLQYKTPVQIADLIKKNFPNHTFENYFDAGCGTGLCGEACKIFTRRRTGVDLSAKMLNKAELKSIYDSLIVGDVTYELSQHSICFDLITAADVLIYIGALEPFFAASFQKLNSRGVLAFSVETCEEDFQLGESGRYAHSIDYVVEKAADFNFRVISCTKENIRKNMGTWIEGALFLFEKP